MKDKNADFCTWLQLCLFALGQKDSQQIVINKSTQTLQLFSNDKRKKGIMGKGSCILGSAFRVPYRWFYSRHNQGMDYVFTFLPGILLLFSPSFSLSLPLSKLLIFNLWLQQIQTAINSIKNASQATSRFNTSRVNLAGKWESNQKHLLWPQFNNSVIERWNLHEQN